MRKRMSEHAMDFADLQQGKRFLLLRNTTVYRIYQKTEEIELDSGDVMNAANPEGSMVYFPKATKVYPLEELD